LVTRTKFETLAIALRRKKGRLHHPRAGIATAGGLQCPVVVIDGRE